MGIRIKLNRSITDTGSLSVLPKDSEYDIDKAPVFIKELFQGGDPRIEKVKVMVEKTEVEPKTEKAKSSAKKVTKAKPVKKLKGVGPSVESKLNEAGVFTADQLEALGKEKLANIIGTLAAANILKNIKV